MGDHAEFKDHIEMQAYAERSGLDYTFAGTKLFAKCERTCRPISSRCGRGREPKAAVARQAKPHRNRVASPAARRDGEEVVAKTDSAKSGEDRPAAARSGRQAAPARTSYPLSY